ncbi:hypothetical protein L1887_52120 [Cichorium endivia]|nr:hypothetical protein L1887_52120 [Cichorium endivia]
MTTSGRPDLAVLWCTARSTAKLQLPASAWQPVLPHQRAPPLAHDPGPGPPKPPPRLCRTPIRLQSLDVRAIMLASSRSAAKESATLRSAATPLSSLDRLGGASRLLSPLPSLRQSAFSHIYTQAPSSPNTACHRPNKHPFNMQFNKSIIAFQALLLTVLIAGTQAQFLSDVTSALGGVGQTIASGATSVFGDATSGAAGAFSTVTSGAGGAFTTVTSGAGGAFSTATSGAASVATSVASGASSVASQGTSGAGSVASQASSGVTSATSRASNAAAASTINGMPVNALAATFTVLLGSAIAGTLIL